MVAVLGHYSTMSVNSLILFHHSFSLCNCIVADHLFHFIYNDATATFLTQVRAASNDTARTHVDN